MSCARGPTGMILVSLCAYGVLLSLLSSSESQLMCTKCKAGNFANHSLPSCSLCHPGSCEVDEEGKSYCTPCPRGQNQSSDGSGSCENCPSGTFANVTGLRLCYLCPEGMHYNKTGAEMCLPCQPGRNASRAGSVNCQLCPTGSICNATGCSTCQTCKAGTAPSVGSTYCANCPEGTYGKTGVTCEPCSGGHFCSHPSCTNCSVCDAGTVSFENKTGCHECSAGTYSDPGSTQCTQCELGKICDHMGCPDCWPCPAGQEPQYILPTLCDKCHAGTYRSNDGEPYFCTTCKSGHYQPLPGQKTCYECPSGSYCPDPSTMPVLCPHGAHCPNGSSKPIWCHSLFSYSSKKEECVAQPVLYIMVVCLTVFVLLVIALVSFAVYWNMCRKRKKMQDKLPLVPKKKSNKTGSQEPTYTGL